ncbi:cation diffusion facilitator family transporter [Vulcanisaeta thermophila]|uniref:cation diffusion facilitator family transporter n=1 Tax=Vulcanisaeta thermophila TaxID=867917 RepID=UPI00085347B1|nr:cation diffusion facilitator family transporter [Vulcanisaeta thermophila]
MLNLWGNEKVRIAFLSLVASVSITIMNIIAWWLTKSAAVLAESVHTALDIVITVITLVAVGVGSKPPDMEHPYGHGKAESIGGLFGSLFMILAGLLVGYEAAEKLIMKIPFKPDIVAVVLLGIAIIIDTNRFRALGRAAVKWNSRALEADSYHFKSDAFISASIVALMIIGLLMDRYYPGVFDYWGSLIDAIAAFAVIIYFGLVGARILRASIDELMDRISEELTSKVREAALTVPNVVGVSNVRARRVGTLTHVELTIKVPDHLGIAEAHQVADNVESAIKRVIGPSLVMVHEEPTLYDKVNNAINSVVKSLGVVNVHEVNIIGNGDSILVTMHVTLNDNTTLKEAQGILNAIEDSIKRVVPAKVWIHLEPSGVSIENLRVDDVRRIIEGIVNRYGGYVREVEVIRAQGLNAIRVLLALPGNTTVVKAHNIATEVEAELSKVYSMPGHIIITVIPAS